MTNKILNTNSYSIEKLRATMDSLSKKITASTALNDILAEANKAFKQFYDNIANQEFTPTYLETGDTAKSEQYNKNLTDILNDITRIYKQIEAVAEAQIKSFNYSQVVNQEIITRSNQLASTVLDLKILSDFTRGDVLIAGDDFKSLDTVDQNVATASPKAEKMFSSGGLSLKRSANRSVVDKDASVDIFPIAPTSQEGSVNTKPTPGNIERFYEGLYYSFIGSARPEGGKFNIQFLLQPKEGEASISQEDTKNVTDDSGLYSNANAGYFIEVGASEEERKEARFKMFDGDPATFWECEYIFDVPTPLINNLIDNSSIENNNNESKGHKDNAARGASVVIDYKEAEKAAKAFDYDGRDIIVEIVITFSQAHTINYVIIDPVIFGVNSFVEVLDIATASDEGQFITVDGWNSSQYAKTLTPEANKYLNDNQVGQLLAPSRYEYTGKGVFSFPSKESKKVKIKIKVDNPVPAIYQRYYILLKQQVDIDTEIKTTTKRGLFR